MSPHLSIYRFRYTMTTSIANRITGLGLSFGFVLLVYWLVAIAGGERAYQYAYRGLAHVMGRILLALLLVTFVYHTLAGIRHLIWDLGYGLEREQAQRSAWLLGAATLVISGWLIYRLFISAGSAA